MSLTDVSFCRVRPRGSWARDINAKQMITHQHICASLDLFFVFIFSHSVTKSCLLISERIRSRYNLQKHSVSGYLSDC
jgi:hypothetical protein